MALHYLEGFPERFQSAVQSAEALPLAAHVTLQDYLNQKGESPVAIFEAMADPKLFGPWFRGDTWEAWRAFLAALVALPIGDAQAEIYNRHTGRSRPPSLAAREAWV